MTSIKIEHPFGARAGSGDSEMCYPFDVSYIPVRCGTYIINLNRAIEEVAQFDYAIQAMNMANEDDEIEIRLQCPGGSLDATDALIHAMRSCKAPIHTVATGNCSSAASAILLESHSFELSDGFSSLIHCGSLGAGGAFNEFNASTKFHQEFMPSWMRKTYNGFLTDEEIEGLIKGQDIWLNAEQWGERYNKRNEWAAKIMEEAMKPAAKPRKSRVKKAVDTAQET
jgi:ATP-dependent protease ClpP protease subunit